MSDNTLKRPSFWAASVALVIFGLGVLGWLTTDPSLGLLDAAYLSLSLFVIEPSAVGEISLALHFARFLAPVMTSVALIAVFTRLLRSQFALERAKRRRTHTVVLGSGPEAVPLARAFRTTGNRAVTCIGEFSPSAAAQLRRDKVLHLEGVDDVALRKLLRGAERVVITAGSDRAAAAITRRAQQSVVGDVPLLTFFSNRDMADDWNSSTGLMQVCRTAHIATAVLREHPPYAEDALTRSPVVVGDGELAAELTRRSIEGWQQPAERRTVHCVGPDPAWMAAAVIGLEEHARLQQHLVEPVARLVTEQVLEARDSWVEPDKVKLYTVLPFRVYVAFDDDTLTLPIANMIARELIEDVRVIAVLDEPASEYELHGGVTGLGRRELLCDPDQLNRSHVDDLAGEIVADLGRWPDEVPSAFGEIRREPGATAILSEQSDEIQQAVRAVAEGAGPILQSVGISASTMVTGRPVNVLTPAQLQTVARRLEPLMAGSPPDVEEREYKLRLLELASRLPALLRRTGRTPVRADDSTDFLDNDQILALAKLAHSGYVSVAEEKGNVTGSRNAYLGWDELDDHTRGSNVAQVLDIPLKLAAVGLGVRLAEEPVPEPLSDDVVELLAEQEHRRWMHYEMRNSRHEHESIKFWYELGEEKEFDRAAVRRIPEVLASVGYEIAPMVDLHDEEG